MLRVTGMRRYQWGTDWGPQLSPRVGLFGRGHVTPWTPLVCHGYNIMSRQYHPPKSKGGEWLHKFAHNIKYIKLTGKKNRYILSIWLCTHHFLRKSREFVLLIIVTYIIYIIIVEEIYFYFQSKTWVQRIKPIHITHNQVR